MAAATTIPEPMDSAVFDPRIACCKTPYGAVRAGETVTLTLRPKRAEGVFRCALTARYEFEHDRAVTQPMRWSGLEEGRDAYTAALETAAPGLVWYSFTLERFDGGRVELGPYQLTVYDGAEQTPAWFGEGVTYQIFPDRFARSKPPDPTGLAGERTVHASWEDEPEYRPDPSGKIRNRDFFGGDLRGVVGKLDYLKGLGVDTIYFCPVFEAAENHRYGVADYERIDPMLGDEGDFAALCGQAHARGMKVLLDGVFNHTGFVSRYFNGDGFYPDVGAAQSEGSPYYRWYSFTRWPDEYDSWWGIRTLPAVNEGEESYRDFIFGGENAVVRRWLRVGADGYRLDVADELPDDFVHGIHRAARETKPDAVVIGEVWEDGTTKIAYGARRRHLLGGYCDGLMNYPFRTAALDYLLGGGAERFKEEMETLREHYPPFAFYSAMNALGTHDTPRVLTLLGVGSPCTERSRDWRAAFRLSPEQRRRGTDLLKTGAALLFCFPGSPTVYYGDEVGMEGFEDPFNRRAFPWGREDGELRACFAALGALRRDHPALRRGDIQWLAADGPLLAFTRAEAGETLLCVCNAGEVPARLEVDGAWHSLFGPAAMEDGPALSIPPRSGSVLLAGEPTYHS